MDVNQCINGGLLPFITVTDVDVVMVHAAYPSVVVFVPAMLFASTFHIPEIICAFFLQGWILVVIFAADFSEERRSLRHIGKEALCFILSHET